MALNPSNSNNLEQLELKGLIKNVVCGGLVNVQLKLQ